jgi:outer membrane receptor protein involved in Fe transport
MNLFSSIILSVIFLSPNVSENGIVKGKVFDSETQEPLPGASISVSNYRGVVTDGNGFYSIFVPQGAVTITYRFIGYKSQEKTIIVNSNDTLTINIGLEELYSEIDQIVVSAGRLEQRLSELTVSLSIIEPRVLESGHITDAKELLSKTSGVEVLDGQASIRSGSGFSYGAGSRVLTLVDGLPALSADAGNIKWQFLPLENISQIEIIKGASSVMYGSSALNGIINIRTSDISNKTESKFFVETGFFGNPQQKKWIWWDTPRFFSSASLSSQFRHKNTHFSIGSFFLFNNGYRRLNDEKLDRINLKIHHKNSKIEGLSYGINFNSGKTKKTDFVLWENAETGALKQSESTAIGLNAIYLTIDPYISLKSTDKHTHDVKIRLQSTLNNFPDAENNNSDALSIFSEYQIWHKIIPALSINTGISYTYSLIVSPFYGNHYGINTAGFSQLNYSPSQRLRFVAGVRLENNSLDGISDKLVPLFRAGANYRLLDYTYLRASYGQGYRFPSIAEKYAATTLGAVRIFPNSYLEPEFGWNSEIGVKQAIDINEIRGLIDLSLFYTQNKDLIEYVFGIYPDGMGFRATNIEYSRVYGFEVEIGLNKELGQFSNSITSGYVYTYPIEFDPITGFNAETFLKFRRKHSGNINLFTSFKKYEIGLSVNARSKILNIDDVFLNPLTREDILPGFYNYWLQNNKGHIVFDATFGFQLNKHLRLSLAIKNLANKEYMGRPGDIMPHRNVSIRLSGRI